MGNFFVIFFPVRLLAMAYECQMRQCVSRETSEGS